jgi:hypothetical protein
MVITGYVLLKAPKKAPIRRKSGGVDLTCPVKNWKNHQKSDIFQQFQISTGLSLAGGSKEWIKVVDSVISPHRSGYENRSK